MPNSREGKVNADQRGTGESANSLEATATAEETSAIWIGRLRADEDKRLMDAWGAAGCVSVPGNQIGRGSSGE